MHKQKFQYFLEFEREKQFEKALVKRLQGFAKDF